MGVGRRRRLRHGLDLRPRALGRDARRALARRRPGARRGGGRHGAPAARHLGGDAQLPPSRDPGPRRHRAGRPERWAPGPRPRAREARDPTPARSGRTRGPRPNGWPASRSSSRCCARSSSGSGTTRTTVHTAHYDAAEAPSTPGTVQDPLPLTIAAGGSKGLRLAALYGQQWVTIGPGRRTAATRGHPGGGPHATGPARGLVPSDRPTHAVEGPPVDADRDRARVGRAVRGAGGPLRRTRLRRVRAAPPGSDRALPGKHRAPSRRSPPATRSEVRARSSTPSVRSSGRPWPRATRGLVEPGRVRPAPR